MHLAVNELKEYYEEFEQEFEFFFENIISFTNAKIEEL